MDYVVQAVGDDELPEGVNVVLVEREGQHPLLLVSGAHARVWRMMQSFDHFSKTQPDRPICLKPRPLLRAV